MNTKEKLIQKLTTEIEQRQSLIKEISKLKLDQINLDPVIMGGQMIDFDNLPHSDVIKVIKSIGGKWDKVPSSEGGRINYSTRQNGITYRCWSGEPPPNCKVIEVLETIPAVPERMVTVRKLVCQ